MSLEAGFAARDDFMRSMDELHRSEGAAPGGLEIVAGNIIDLTNRTEADGGQPMTQAQTNEIIAAIEAARTAGRVVIAVEFPRSLALAEGPWSIRGVDLIYHSWYTDGFNLKLEGTGSFRYDDEYHQFGAD